MSENMFGDRLRAAREKRGWTQRGLGIEADMDATSLSKFESGERQPSARSIVRLAKAMNVSADYLLGLLPAEVDTMDSRLSLEDHQALLDQWNEMVNASGSKTHGGAIGHVAQLRRERDRLLVLATKHCPIAHHDFDEIKVIANDEALS